MQFRDFAATLTTALVVGMLPAYAQGQGQTLRIAYASAENDLHSMAWEVFAEELEAALPGRFNVELYPNGSLYRQGDQVAAMARGNLEAGHMSNNLIAAQVPSASILTSGYLFRDAAHICTFWTSDLGEELADRVANEVGIRVLSAGYLGTRHVSLRETREVNTPEDLAGVRLRMPDSDTWLFLGSALGAQPTPLAFGELYLALRAGAVDGQDNPLPTLVSNNFYEVQDQVVLTSHLVDSILFSVSESFWQSLDEGEQAALTEAAWAGADFNTRKRIEVEATLVEFLKENGMEVTTPDVDAFRTRVQAAYRDSRYSQDWETGMLEAINALQPEGRCAQY
jgi:TRAP-type transport system periplasmic protein